MGEYLAAPALLDEPAVQQSFLSYFNTIVVSPGGDGAAPAPPRPLTRWLRLPHTARQGDLPNAAPPAVVEPGQECVLQLQVLPLRLVLFSPSVGEL